MKAYYEVRVKIRKDGKEVKKSAFFNANSPDEAAKHYRGPGTILTVTKASREKILGIGEFFKYGEELLAELKQMQKPETEVKGVLNEADVK